MNISSGWEGALRGLGAVLLITLCAWLSNAANIAFIGNPWTISAIVAIAGFVEGHIKGVSGKGLFGATRAA